MELGAITNPDAVQYGKPLEGVRILALEQMQALPYATQLLARLGADVVKVESVKGGDLGRGSQPGITDPDGRFVGATYLRNNLDKKSICVDLKAPEGKQLILDLAPKFDIVAENFKGGALSRMGLGYDDIAAVHPGVIYLSVSGFGNTVATPYDGWPAYAAVAEAMSGIYDYKLEPGRPPAVSPVGALGDIGTALFGTIGILAALRHRDRTGLGQYIDVAMFDAMVSMTDLVTNFWSLGLRPAPGQGLAMILDGFEASNGWFIIQVGREHEFERLANLIGKPEWKTDPAYTTPKARQPHIMEIFATIENWLKDKTKFEAVDILRKFDIPCAPVLSMKELLNDKSLRASGSIVDVPHKERGSYVTVGSPIKFSDLKPEITGSPLLGEHTDEILSELGYSKTDIANIHAAKAV
jgi:formyl-CoA transferase